VQPEIQPAPEIKVAPAPEAVQAADSQVNLESPVATVEELPKELPQQQQPESPASIEPAPLSPQTALPVSEEPVPTTVEVKPTTTTVEQPIPAVQPEIQPAPEIKVAPAPEAVQAADSQVNLETPVTTAEEPPKDWPQEPAPGPMLDQVQANTQISAQADEPVFSHETSPLMAPRPVIDYSPANSPVPSWAIDQSVFLDRPAIPVNPFAKEEEPLTAREHLLIMSKLPAIINLKSVLPGQFIGYYNQPVLPTGIYTPPESEITALNNRDDSIEDNSDNSLDYQSDDDSDDSMDYGLDDNVDDYNS
ncbi:MAG: hypothetical protein LBS44_05715, partial [Deltaproteobacteria bacterium]|nr:hypothetical protein [Deltaproteobacteria bacterium]